MTAEAPPMVRPEGLAAWWDALAPVDTDAEVAAYLRWRGIDPAIVADRDLARAVPREAPIPPWGYHGYLLVVPAYDAAGELASVRQHQTGAGDGPKSLAPRDTDASGVLFADPLGRELLRTGAVPAWWPVGRRLEVIVADGEIDALAIATSFGDAEPCAPAVLGIGHWTPALAARIPHGAQVKIAPGADPAGDRYDKQIASTLADRAELRRWRAS